MVVGDARRDVVPPRPPPGGQPGPPRGLRRRRRAPAVRARPGALGPGRASPPRLPRRLAAVPRRLAPAAAHAARRWSAATRSGGWCWPPARSARTGSTSRPTTAPTAARRDAAGRAGAGRARHRAGPHRLAVRRGAGPGDQAARASPTRCSRRSRRPGPTTAGAARSTPRPARAGWSSTTPSTSPTGTRPTGSTLPEAGEAAAARRWRAFLDERVADYDTDRDRPDLDGTSHMSVHLKWGEIHPRTMLADLAPAAQRRRRDVPQGAGLAGVLRRRAVPPAGDRPRLPPAGVRADGVRRARRPRSTPGGAAAPASRSSTPACAAARDRLDAQPGADDRGQLPGQGPARRVAARRPALHALAGRRRPRLQPARLAVGGRLRHRRGAVLPGLQPDHPGPQVRPRRRLRPPLGARARRRRRPARAAARSTATRRRSSTTPRSVARRWTGGRGSGR